MTPILRPTTEDPATGAGSRPAVLSRRCPVTLTAVSLFAGIGGFDLALQRAGVDVVAAVEIDPAARGVLADRFPDTTLFCDVRSVTADAIRAAGFVPERGILTAGFPCQDLSIAGNRRGLGEGTRSGLFWEIVRLVAELRPAWLILENVPGLLSATCPCPGTGEHQAPVAVRTGDDGDDPVETGYRPCGEPHPVRGGACEGGCFPAHGGAMGLVLGALADLGYGVAYRVLDAQFFGVPQRRRRVFIVGRAGGDTRGPVQVLLEPEGRAGDPSARRAAGQDVAGTLGSRAGGGRTTDLDGHGAYILDSPGTSSVSTLSGGGHRGFRVDAEGAAGGHLIPCGALTSSSFNIDDNTALAGHLIASAITAREGKGPDSDATTTLVPVAIQDGRERAAKEQNGLGVSEPGAPAYTLDTTGGQAVAFDGAQITSPGNRSNPRPGDPAPTLSSTGNPHVASTLTAGQSSAGVSRPGRHAEDDVNLVTHALTDEGHDASEDGTGRGTPLVPISLAVAGEFSTGEGIAQTIRAAKGQPGTVAVPLDPRNALRADGSTRAGAPGTGGGEGGDPAGTLSTDASQGVAIPIALRGRDEGNAIEAGEPGDPAFTVRTPGGGSSYPMVAAAAVRRLTPLECERLQGLPDRWTATSGGLPQADSARYRQLGNAVAVPVVEWIVRRTTAHHTEETR